MNNGDGLNQMKLKKDGNQLGIQIKSNPAAQRRFNIATARMVSKGFLSFIQAEGIKLLTEAIWPNRYPKVVITSNLMVCLNSWTSKIPRLTKLWLWILPLTTSWLWSCQDLFLVSCAPFTSSRGPWSLFSIIMRFRQLENASTSPSLFGSHQLRRIYWRKPAQRSTVTTSYQRFSRPPDRTLSFTASSLLSSWARPSATSVSTAPTSGLIQSQMLLIWRY